MGRALNSIHYCTRVVVTASKFQASAYKLLWWHFVDKRVDMNTFTLSQLKTLHFFWRLLKIDIRPTFHAHNRISQRWVEVVVPTEIVPARVVAVLEQPEYIQTVLSVRSSIVFRLSVSLSVCLSLYQRTCTRSIRLLICFWKYLLFSQPVSQSVSQ